MLIEVTTDHNIPGGEGLSAHVRATVETTLVKYADRLTRVMVHFTDENSHKKSDTDKRCAIEARPAGHQPMAATHLAATLDEALEGAADRLQRQLEHTFGRLDHHKGRTPMGGPTD